MIKYVFSEAPLRFKNADKLDAQKIGEAVAEVRAIVARKERTGARLDKDSDSVPKLLYTRATRDQDHPIAPALERNEKRGCYLYNLGVIRGLINTIRIVNEDTGSTMRAFVHVGRTRNTEPGYKSAGDIVDSFSMQLAVYRLAERDLAAFERRYSQLVELCSGVRKLREQARQTIETLETTGARGGVSDAAQDEGAAA